MVQEYEYILPPPEFWDGPIPEPRTRRRLIPAPWTKIEQTSRALGVHAESYEIRMKKIHYCNSMRIERPLKCILKIFQVEREDLNLLKQLVVTFEKNVEDEGISKTAYFNSQTQTIINEMESAEALELNKQHMLRHKM